MDDFSLYNSPEGSSRLSRRNRTNSQTSHNSNAVHASTSKFRGTLASGRQQRNRATSSSLSVASGCSDCSDWPEIHSPTPRRHLLESSASKHWLQTPPPISPITSRGTSPASPIPHHLYPLAANPNSNGDATASSVHTMTPHFRSSSHRPLSFSSIAESNDAQRETKRSRPSTSGTGSAFLKTSASGFLDRTGVETEVEETGAARRLVKWMHRRGMKPWVLTVAVVSSFLIRWCVGLASYSGQGVPPMHGDYEAQRHWMEITLHLPIREWYTYDLQYWGLDYPPLTAYVSWLCGIVGSRINPSWFALDKSRGIETVESKVFMRATVMVFDALVYIPALLMFVRMWLATRSKRTQSIALLTLLFQPGLLLIDHGHFQYNSVMLGLALLTMNFFATGQDLLGAVCFVLSLGFKQMALYYAPAIGCYLLAKCLYLGPAQGARLFIRLGLVTTVSFVVLFLPFLPPFAPLSAIRDPITRIFPFSRGLFEDKVANFWCTTNVVFKWNVWTTRPVLVKLSGALTALGFLPSIVVLLRSGIKMQVTGNSKHSEPTPILPLLPYALLTSSMSFFLFSFQVHEKTVLVPLLPMTLLMSGASPDSTIFAWGSLANNVGVFSMWPLLKRDGLGVPYVATLLLWNRLIGHSPFRIKEKNHVQYLSITVYSAALVLHLLEIVKSPPARYPDLYPVLNVLICTPVFVLVWLWSIKCCVQVSWALSGLGVKASTSKAKAVDASVDENSKDR